MVRAEISECSDLSQAGRRGLAGPAMEISEDGDSDPNVMFWRRQFQRFLYAETETEAVSALAEALRSNAVMPHIFRLVLADMLEGGSVRLSGPSWTIRAVRRQDAKQTRARIAVWQQYREVQELIKQGRSMTVACREVADRHGKTQ